MGTLVLLSASWGLHHVAIKAAIGDVPPVFQSAIRTTAAAGLVWGWMAARRIPVFEADGTLRAGIAAGLLFGFEFLLIYWGLSFTHASRSIVFIYFSPFVVALGAHWFIPGERIRAIQVAGLIVAFAGIVAAFADALTFPTYRQLIGDAMILLAAVLWGATTVLVKASRLAVIAPGKTLLYQLGVAAVILALATPFLENPGDARFTQLAVASLFYQALWVAFITYLIWFWLIQRYPATRLAAFTFLTPLFGVFAGGVLLGEPMSDGLLAALVLVGAGVYLVNRPPSGADA